MIFQILDLKLVLHVLQPQQMDFKDAHSYPILFFSR